MRLRIGRILAAVFWFVWAGVIVPGHTRGIITNNQGGSCASACCRSSKKPVDAPPVPLTSKNCAVCAAAAKLGHQMVAVPAALKLGFVEFAVLPDVNESPALAALLTLQTRGPPVSSSHIDLVG